MLTFGVKKEKCRGKKIGVKIVKFFGGEKIGVKKQKCRCEKKLV